MKILVLTLSLIVSSTGFAKANTSICATLNQAISKGTPAQKLGKFLDEQWKYSMTESPEFATYVGYPGQNDRWTDYSLEAIARRKNEKSCELSAITRIPRASLTGEDRINFDLVKRDIELSIEGDKFGDDYLVLDHLDGLHMEVADLLQAMPAVTKADYENMISRLEKVPAVEEQQEILLREGLKKKITAVKMFLTRVPAQFDKVLTDKAEDSPLYAQFKDINSNLSPEETAQLRSRAKTAIETKVFPALRKLKTFVVNEYIPGARESISMKDMPNGAAWYAYQVKSHTTTSMTPEELHQLGLKEVARITTEMEKIRDQVKFRGDLRAFNKFLLTDSQFYYTDKEKLLLGFRDIAKRIDPELTKIFKTLPRQTYGVREMPEYKAKEAPAAYYEGGSLEAGRPGYFTANTYDLKARPKWGMEALTLHEAVPGHHFQLSIASELKGFPEFRKHSGQTAFVEGWGL